MDKNCSLAESTRRKLNVLRRSRAQGPYRSVADFRRRSGIAGKVVERLARADAFGSIKLDRRSALWQALGQGKGASKLPLFDGVEDSEAPVELPAMSRQDEVFADYRTAGLSLKAHPISFYRSNLDRLCVETAANLSSLGDGSFVAWRASSSCGSGRVRRRALHL